MTPNTSNLKVTVFWGDILYDTLICEPKDTVTIGSELGNTFNLTNRKSYRLLEVQPDNKARLFFDDQIDGHVRMGQELLSLSTARNSKYVAPDGKGGYQIDLSRSDKADVVIGHVSLYFDWLDRTEVLPRTRFLEKKKLLPLLAFLVATAAVIAASYLIEIPEPEKPPERLVMLEPRHAKAPPAPLANPGEAPSKAAMGQPKTKDGGAQKGEPGKAETKTPETLSAAASLRKANLGSLVNGLTAVGANAPRVSDSDAGVVAPMEQAGTKGFTNTGTGQGAGGQTVGIGRTVGQGEGGFSGTGRLGLRGNSAIEGDGSGNGGGATAVGGGLDRDVIESIIRRRLDRIRLCYERQLNFFPKLSGKVTVHFVIGKVGEVLSSAAVEDTMRNDAVRSCILAEVKSWNFPAPEGGTLVNVDYPFVFESTAKTQ